MKVAFVTEMNFEGKVPSNYQNMRTEFSWMHTMDATHFHIRNLLNLNGYDKVFIIFPKGKVFLSAEGSTISDSKNPVSDLLEMDLVGILKSKGNKSVFYVQEGPHWWFNDYEIVDQIRFYNMISSCDGIYAHNESDLKYYKGLFPDKEVRVIPTLMVEELIKDIKPIPEDKVIIGGNFCRWYGGFESYIVASNFGLPIWVQTSHAMRKNEESIGINHLPRVSWVEWMKQLSSFKYAVHLMSTVAAGTFSLNCAYFGIPCIGNVEVDTQRICHPELSVHVGDIQRARELVLKLSRDNDFYNECSNSSVNNFKSKYSINNFIEKMYDVR